MRPTGIMNFALILLLALLPSWPATGAEVAGINFPDKVQVGESDLVLNGTGIRARFFIKVYAMGIYLGERKTSAADVLAAKTAKRIQIVTLRDLSAEDFAKALVEGIQRNAKDAAYAPLKARTEGFERTILALKSAPKGALVQIDWLPASGTRLLFNGAKSSEDIPGEDFYQALLNIWLGDQPAAQDLKEGLLGKTP